MNPAYCPRMFRAGAHFMFLVLVLGLLLLREAQLPPLRGLDESFADFLARNSLHPKGNTTLTIVEINQASLKNHPLPWTPLDYALFFQAANGFQPAALATDTLLQWDEKTVT